MIPVATPYTIVSLILLVVLVVAGLISAVCENIDIDSED
jgi:hypothetical protein